MNKIIEGIIIGGAGGASAGIVVAVFGTVKSYIVKKYKIKRIETWLKRVTQGPNVDEWRSTHAIASFNNLTEDMVRYLASCSKNIIRSSGEKEIWGYRGIARAENETGESKREQVQVL